MDFQLNDRQKEILSLLNDGFRLGVPPEEISTLKGAARIYDFAQDMETSDLHDLGIARRSLKEISAMIRRAGGTVEASMSNRMRFLSLPVDDEGVGYGLGLDFMLEGI